MTITDEMVEIAQNTWRFAQKNHMRAALEAVAPMIIAEAFETRPPALIKDALDRAINKARAQGMREAFAIAIDHEDLNAILERAQELDPQNELAEPQRVIRGKARIRRAQELDPK